MEDVGLRFFYRSDGVRPHPRTSQSSDRVREHRTGRLVVQATEQVRRVVQGDDGDRLIAEATDQIPVREQNAHWSVGRRHRSRGSSTSRQDDVGSHQPDLPQQPRPTRLQLARRRVTVRGWAALHRVADVDGLRGDLRTRQETVEKLSRRSYKGTPLSVLAFARSLAYEHQRGAGGSTSDHDVLAVKAQPASRATEDFDHERPVITGAYGAHLTRIRASLDVGVTPYCTRRCGLSQYPSRSSGAQGAGLARSKRD